jgi:hypothetical protein
MSADLLRRAADKLRKAANDVEAFSPWTAETAPDGRAWVNVPGAVHAWGMHGFPGECRYAALMHPPVALALADAMDAVAPAVQYGGGFAARVGYGELIAVACAVLREDGESA